MAAVMSMVELMDSYVKGRGWKWGECDCIGLLFHCVNYAAPHPQLRADWLPVGMGYNDAVMWLADKWRSPLDPYISVMSDAGITPTEITGTPSISFVFGGEPLASKTDAHVYPVNPVPGIVFTTTTNDHYALMLGGLRGVNLRQKDGAGIIRTILRYPLHGIQ